MTHSLEAEWSKNVQLASGKGLVLPPQWNRSHHDGTQKTKSGCVFLFLQSHQPSLAVSTLVASSSANCLPGSHLLVPLSYELEVGGAGLVPST